MTTVDDRVRPTSSGRPRPVPRPATGASAHDRVLPRTRALLVAFTGLTALATNQLLVLGGRTDRFWAWTIEQRPTASFLGAAYAAGCLLSVLSLRQRSWAQVRVAVATVAVFTSLTLVATLWHAHRLHLVSGDPVPRAAAWIWLGVYLVVPAVCVGVVLRQGGVAAPRPVPGAAAALPTWLRAALAGQAAVLLAAGLVLFAGGLAVHHGTVPAADFWPWPLAPLGAQVVGAWLTALAVGAALGLADGDLRRLRVPAAAWAAFGLLELGVLVSSRGAAAGSEGSLLAGVALFASMAWTGGYGWWRSRSVDATVAGSGPGAWGRAGGTRNGP